MVALAARPTPPRCWRGLGRWVAPTAELSMAGDISGGGLRGRGGSRFPGSRGRRKARGLSSADAAAESSADADPISGARGWREGKFAGKPSSRRSWTTAPRLFPVRISLWGSAERAEAANTREGPDWKGMKAGWKASECVIISLTWRLLRDRLGSKSGAKALLGLTCGCCRCCYCSYRY